MDGRVVVVVGFKVTEENSVYYVKLRNPEPLDMGVALAKAFDKGADFCSVRIVRR